MGRLFRLMKLGFFVGGTVYGLTIFQSFKGHFDMKRLAETLSLKKELKITEAEKSTIEANSADGLREQNAAAQRAIQESQKERVQKSLVKYREVDYVFINGKYYPYNPKNIYNVDGVKTLYIPGGYDEMRELRASSRIKSLESQYNLSNSHLVEKAQELIKNPLEGYSPSGIRKMQEALSQIQQKAEARNALAESL